MWEQYHINKMDEVDLELRQIKERIGDKLFSKYMRFFKNVAKNTNDALKESQIYITQESLEKKLKIHFGHRCDFLTQRFYAFLADSV